MRNIIWFLIIGVLLFSCKGEQITTSVDDTALIAEAYKPYGASITAEEALAPQDAITAYQALKQGDTTTLKIEAPINSVCANKGCWMRLAMGEQEEVFVKFKDYGFFVPKDASGKAVVQGKAYIEEVSVEELQHLATDAGKSEEEVAAITEPQRELRFMAEGVLISQ